MARECTAESTKISPRFDHDCDGCLFLGVAPFRGKNCDWYVCGRHDLRVIIARYDNAQGAYFSGTIGECVEIQPVVKCALSHGLELNGHEIKALFKMLIKKDLWESKLRDDIDDGNPFALGDANWWL